MTLKIAAALTVLLALGACAAGRPYLAVDMALDPGGTVDTTHGAVGAQTTPR